MAIVDRTRRMRLRQFVVHDHAHTPRPVAHPIQAEVRGDAIQPRADTGGAVELGIGAIGPQPRLLKKSRVSSRSRVVRKRKRMISRSWRCMVSSNGGGDPSIGDLLISGVITPQRGWRESFPSA